MGVEWELIGAIFNDLDNEKGLKNKQSYYSARSWEMRVTAFFVKESISNPV